jgi:hypothetical protein
VGPYLAVTKHQSIWGPVVQQVSERYLRKNWMPFTRNAKIDAHALFDDQRPSPDGLAGEYVVGFVSAMCFQPMEDGEMVVRLAGEDSEIIDLRTNPVCAGRLAIALLDMINRNGWFDVDLPDGNSEIARITPPGPSVGKSFACEPTK